MKKILILVFLIFLTSNLTACNFKYDSFNSDVEKMLEVYDDVIDALNNNDADYLYSLFAKKISNEVDSLLIDSNTAIDYYHGDFVSNKNYSGLGVLSDKNYDLVTKEYVQTRKITTTSSIYYISIKYFAEHSLDPNEIGIVSLYILEHDDTKEEQFTGSRLWTPGINIGIRSEGI